MDIFDSKTLPSKKTAGRERWKAISMKTKRNDPVKQLSLDMADLNEDVYIDSELKSALSYGSRSAATTPTATPTSTLTAGARAEVPAIKPSVLHRLTKFFKRQSSDSSLIASTQRGSNQDLVRHGLLGRPLQEICSPNRLPAQLMELLQYLYRYGPSTSEIFRKSAHAKKCAALTQQLELGAINWKDEELNGLLVASVLKRLLREIPDKLLNNNMYDRWSDVVTNSGLTGPQRIHSIRELIEALPSENKLLLKYVICLLLRIIDSSDINLMTDYNISVCIAPCLLWTTSLLPAEVEKASVIVPKLLIFMLNHPTELFGAEVRNLMRDQLAKSASKSLDSVLDTDADRGRHLYTSRYQAVSKESLNMSEILPHPPISKSDSRDSGMIISDNTSDDELQLTSRVRMEKPYRREKTLTVSYGSMGSDDNMSRFTADKMEEYHYTERRATTSGTKITHFSSRNEDSPVTERRPTLQAHNILLRARTEYRRPRKLDNNNDSTAKSKQAYTTTLELPINLLQQTTTSRAGIRHNPHKEMNFSHTFTDTIYQV